MYNLFLWTTLVLNKNLFGNVRIVMIYNDMLISCMSGDFLGVEGGEFSAWNL